MLVSKIYQIEINSEQPEWKVIQKLVQLGFQKAMWEDEAKTSFIGVYIPSRLFSNYTNDMPKGKILTLEDFTNLIGGGGEMKTYNQTEDLSNNERRNKRRLAKIHKHKRENRMLASKRKRIIAKKMEQSYLYSQVSGYSLYLYSIKLCRVSEEIGKNSAKIMRLRTLIKQSKC